MCYLMSLNGILQFYKMTKQRVAFNSFDFRIYKREYFSFNLMVVAFDNLFEIVGANCVSDVLISGMDL